MSTNSITIQWLLSNPWIFKYIGIMAWLYEIVMVKDFIFGIHWLRDLLVPAMFIGLIVAMCLFM